MRYHVIAYGSTEYPDIDGEFDVVPEKMTWRYPVVNVALLTPIRRSDLMQHLDKEYHS